MKAYADESVIEIESIFITGCKDEGLYSKESIHDYLIKNPKTIQVNIYPYPYLIPETSSTGNKYVKSQPDNTVKDNLLSLPRV